MTLNTLIARSLRFYVRSHLGVLLGSAVGSAALVGALVVGDSVRESLRRQAMQRLGEIEWALDAQDRLFRAHLAEEWDELSARDHPWLRGRPVTALLSLPATGALPDGSARANQVQLLGVDKRFAGLATHPLWSNLAEDGVVLNAALASQLQVEAGQTVLLRVRKPSALSREAIVTPQADSTVALRLRVQAVASPAALGDFSLQRSQVPPFNAFVSLARLQAAVDAPGQANIMLVGRATNGQPGATDSSPEVLRTLLVETWQLADAQLELADLPDLGLLELRSPRIFLDPSAAAAALVASSNAQPVLTYLVNQLRVGSRTTPYSMVTAALPPLIPSSLGPDEILINPWLAEDLAAGPGDEVALSFYLADSGARLVEHTHTFRVQAVVPMNLPHADRTLMPEFPGIAQAESTHDWDAGFPLVQKIRDKDDAYWKTWRGTPKAFLTLSAGQKLWSNRFGNLTAVRFPLAGVTDRAGYRAALAKSILTRLQPEAVGLKFEPVRALALVSAAQAQDFAGLFLGFSFFLVVAALILMALLFQFGLEPRLGEVGTLLALGFTPGKVRRLLLAEGAILALAGGIAGVGGGVGYAWALLWGLTTLWRDAIGTSALVYYARPQTYLLGLISAALVSALTIALVLRKQVRRPARLLLSDEAGLEDVSPGDASRGGRWSRRCGGVAGLAAVALVAWAWWQAEPEPAAFFAAGSLLLMAGLAGAAWVLTRLARSEAERKLTIAALGLRGVTRRRKRSLASVALLACGTFLVIAVGANRLDASRNAQTRSAGTGGFALIGESTLPILRDLNTPAGQEFYGLTPEDLREVAFVPMRVRDGDEASCLNLQRAQRPKLLGVDPVLLDQRQAFTFTKTAGPNPPSHPWLLLRDTSQADPDVIPAIGDANSIRWALDKKLGDTLEYTDQRGRPFKIRLVGAVANSVLQGYLLVDEQAFLRRFPSLSGYRLFLVDAPPARAAAVSGVLSRALQDAGLELTATARRLASFNAVQNTYLETFQVLGAMGLLLGSAGLGVVVLRNVLERRGELALLQAVGFRRRRLQWLVLSEHGGLLGMGLATGTAAALLAVLPVLLQPGADWPIAPLILTLSGVLANGLFWTWLATRLALRGPLLPALRQE